MPYDKQKEIITNFSYNKENIYNSNVFSYVIKNSKIKIIKTSKNIILNQNGFSYWSFKDRSTALFFPINKDHLLVFDYNDVIKFKLNDYQTYLINLVTFIFARDFIIGDISPSYVDELRRNKIIIYSIFLIEFAEIDLFERIESTYSYENFLENMILHPKEEL